MFLSVTHLLQYSAMSSRCVYHGHTGGILPRSTHSTPPHNPVLSASSVLPFSFRSLLLLWHVISAYTCEKYTQQFLYVSRDCEKGLVYSFFFSFELLMKEAALVENNSPPPKKYAPACCCLYFLWTINSFVSCKNILKMNHLWRLFHKFSDFQ